MLHQYRRYVTKSSADKQIRARREVLHTSLSPGLLRRHFAVRVLKDVNSDSSIRSDSPSTATTKHELAAVGGQVLTESKQPTAAAGSGLLGNMPTKYKLTLAACSAFVISNMVGQDVMLYAACQPACNPMHTMIPSMCMTSVSWRGCNATSICPMLERQRLHLPIST